MDDVVDVAEVLDVVETSSDSQSHAYVRRSDGKRVFLPKPHLERRRPELFVGRTFIDASPSGEKNVPFQRGHDDERIERDAHEKELAKLKERLKDLKIASAVRVQRLEDELDKATKEGLKYKQHNIVDRDLHSELLSLRRKIQTLANENAKLKSAASNASAVAAESRASSFSDGTSVSSPQHADEKYAKLRADFEAFKVKAMEVITDQERQLKAASTVDEAANRPDDVHGAGESESRDAYLRNVVLQYLSTGDEVSRSRIETAIVSVLHLSPKEIESMLSKRKKTTKATDGYLGFLSSS